MVPLDSEQAALRPMDRIQILSNRWRPESRGIFNVFGRRSFSLGHARRVRLRQSSEVQKRSGRCILAIDVPDGLIASAVDEYFPLSQGIVQLTRAEVRQSFEPIGTNC